MQESSGARQRACLTFSGRVGVEPTQDMSMRMDLLMLLTKKAKNLRIGAWSIKHRLPVPSGFSAPELENEYG